MSDFDTSFGKLWGEAQRQRDKTQRAAPRTPRHSSGPEPSAKEVAGVEFDRFAALARKLGDVLISRRIAPDIAVYKTLFGYTGRKIGRQPHVIGWLLEASHYSGSSGHYEIDGLAKSGPWVGGSPSSGSSRILTPDCKVKYCSGQAPVYEGKRIRGTRTTAGVTSIVGYQGLRVVEMTKQHYLDTPGSDGTSSILPLLGNLANLAVDYGINPAEIGMAPPSDEKQA